MKKQIFALAAFCSMQAWFVMASPVRVAILDFEDRIGQPSDALLGGAIAPGALADKGIFLLGNKLLNNDSFVLIDRRDFIAQIEKTKPKGDGEKTTARPSFIHAAQMLNADVVLRGSVLAFSPGKQAVDQGGYKTELSTLTARVAIEALDPMDGTVIAMSNGKAERSFRQTAEVKTVLGENEALDVLDGAIADALAPIQKSLQDWRAKQQSRAKLKISVKTNADPALVEIDGVLVGSTPLENFEVYKGDHTLTIGRSGYRDITKRILIEKDMTVEAPMIRIQLSADELKDVLEKMRLNVITAEPGLIIRPLE